MSDFVIPLVWPGYKITLDLPGRPIGVPALGHAGVVLVDGSTARTRYFEYGRYGDVRGVVRTAGIGTHSIGQISIRDGKIDQTSFATVMAEAGNTFGKGSLTSGSLFELPDGSFEEGDV